MGKSRTKPNQRAVYQRSVIEVLQNGPLKFVDFVKQVEAKAKIALGLDFILNTVSNGALSSLKASGDILVDVGSVGGNTYSLNKDLPEYNSEGYLNTSNLPVATEARIVVGHNFLETNCLVSISLSGWVETQGNRNKAVLSASRDYSFELTRLAAILERSLANSTRPLPFVLFHEYPLAEKEAEILAKRLRALNHFYEQPDDVKALIIAAHKIVTADRVEVSGKLLGVISEENERGLAKALYPFYH